MQKQTNYAKGADKLQISGRFLLALDYLLIDNVLTVCTVQDVNDGIVFALIYFEYLHSEAHYLRACQVSIRSVFELV